MNKIKVLFLSMALLSLPLTFQSCTKIKFKKSTGVGEFSAQGKSKTKTFDWENSQSKASFTMDITGAESGSMTMEVFDGTGTKLIDEIVTVGGVDSYSACSAFGNPGTWSVTITITDFNGKGSYTLTEGC